MSWSDLKQFVGADGNDDTFVQSCYATAFSLVEEFIGTEYVPAEIRERATLNVGSELYHQRNAPSGISQFAAFDGNPIRIARDPMTAAYPLLQKWMVIW